VFTYVGAQQIAAQDVSSQALYVSRLPDTKGELHEILNIAHANGVAFNRGPDFAMLQRLGAPVPARTEAPDIRRVRVTGAGGGGDAELVDRTRRLMSVATREYNAFRNYGTTPPPVPVGRPPVMNHAPPALKKPPAFPLPGDSTRFKPAPRDTTKHDGARPLFKKRGAKPLGRPVVPPDSTRG